MYRNILFLADATIPLLKRSYAAAKSQADWLAINQSAARFIYLLRPIVINDELDIKLRRSVEDHLYTVGDILKFTCEMAESYGTPCTAIKPATLQPAP